MGQSHTGGGTKEWIKKIWYIFMMEYYSAIEKNEIMPLAATWMDPETVMLSEVREEEYCMTSIMGNLKRNDTNELIYKIDSQS